MGTTGNQYSSISYRFGVVSVRRSQAASTDRRNTGIKSFCWRFEYCRGIHKPGRDRAAPGRGLSLGRRQAAAEEIETVPGGLLPYAGGALKKLFGN